nr:hypothetical protein [Tanacetum cinerariifolium]
MFTLDDMCQLNRIISSKVLLVEHSSSVSTSDTIAVPLKHNVKTTKKVWKAKVVTVRCQWKPTGRHFTLYDEYPLTRIVEPIVEPLELTLCVSSNSKVTMFSRFIDYKLSNQKAGSKGISGSSNCPLVFGFRMLSILVLDGLQLFQTVTRSQPKI